MCPNNTNVEDNTLLYGDTNCDGVVNISDVVRINRYIAGKDSITEQGMINADVNQDDTVDATDATLILQSLSGIHNLPRTE